jgi:hypothetical protein
MGFGQRGLLRYESRETIQIRSSTWLVSRSGSISSTALGLDWVIATDEYDTDLAVHGARNDVLVHPCNLVAKRWQSGETAFVARVGAELVRDIGGLMRR